MPERVEPNATGLNRGTPFQQVSQSSSRVELESSRPLHTIVKAVDDKEAKRAEKQRLSDAKLATWLANRDDRPVSCLRYGGNTVVRST
jgi:hypothetical protein